MRYEDAIADPTAYEQECKRRLDRKVGPRPPGPERDHLERIGLTWLAVDFEGSFPDTVIVVTVEDLRREQPIYTDRYELWGPWFRSSNTPGLPWSQGELQRDPSGVCADIWTWVLESWR
jgi:hypothetical protein